MIKRLFCLMIALFLVTVLGTTVAADFYRDGEVLYHQDFAVLPPLSHAGVAGIRMGTNSSPEAYLWHINNAMHIVTRDDLRAYMLLPEIPWTESYTIEFTFCMSDIRSNRAYLAFLLTCWGDEPTNITALVIRANGTIDDFSPLSEEMTAILREGTEMIHVQIPIEDGILHEVTLTAGETSCTVQRESLKRISEGNRGFSVRNLTACIGEIYVVNGVGYTAKNGAFAEMSWSEDPTNLPLEESPSTGDAVWWMVSPVLWAGVMVWAKRMKKHG